MLVVATRNAKKFAEVRGLLAPFGVDCRAVADFDEPGRPVPGVVEDGDTFAANAAKKASQTARFLGRPVLGEDSGLCVDALGGAPGIYSARFSAGDEPEGATDDANNRKLVAELTGVPDAKRGAGYVCSIAVADADGEIVLTAEGACRGRIVDGPRGAGGFGYDPHFLVRELHRTFGELPPVVKRHLSHRARALAVLGPKLRFP